MINNFFRGIIYFVVLVLIQVLVLNHIHFFRVAIPFLYVYFILKMPVGTSRTATILLSFLIGFAIDIFTNTPGMHAGACTFAGFSRDFIIQLFLGKDLAEGVIPSYRTFGYGGFVKYAFSFILLHHVALYLLEALTFFDPVFLFVRIFASILLTLLLVCIVESFNVETQKIGD